MDKLSGLASKLSGGNKSGGDAQASGSSGNQGQEDYLDKGEYFSACADNNMLLVWAIAAGMEC